MMAFIVKGTEIHGPAGHGGYRLKEDLVTGQRLHLGLFEAFGGAPAPKDGVSAPSWLTEALEEIFQRKSYNWVSADHGWYEEELEYDKERMKNFHNGTV